MRAGGRAPAWPAAAAALCAAALAGCFSPTYRSDLQCGDDHECPPGLDCDEEAGICRQGGGGAIDAAGPRDAAADAARAGIDAPRPDAAITPPPDATPVDATPVECDDEGDCAMPLDPCLLAGTCEDHVCRFPSMDCSDLDGDCTLGACHDGTCKADPRHEGDACETTTCSYGACGGFADACDEGGTQSGTCTAWTCQLGVCAPETTPATIPCSRDTDGTGCGADVCGPFGGCAFEGDACDETGTQSRTCTPRLCAGGVCGDGTPKVETAGCSRSRPNGFICVAESCGSCNPCVFPDECSTTGDQSCSCSQSQCTTDHVCQISFYFKPFMCSRGSTDGDPCNGGSLCSECDFPTDCAEAGTQDCTTYECASGSCRDVSSGTVDCSRDTDGNECSFILCPDGMTSVPRCCSLGFCSLTCGICPV